MRGLRVLLLGRPRLELDGQALAADLPRKHQALVFYLAAVSRPAPRAELASLLWEDLDEAAARGNLRTALMRLRRSLPGVLAVDGRQVGFDPLLPLHVDLTALADAGDGQGDRITRGAAAGAWRGPLLEGFEPVGDGFEHWLTATRSRAQHLAVTLRRQLAQAAAAEGATDEAEAHWRGLLDVDDTDEPAHMALMALLAASGRRTAAIAQYEACRAALADRLGARPSTDCYALYTRIHADAAGAPAQSAPEPARFAASSDPPGGTVAGETAGLDSEHGDGRQDEASGAVPVPEGPLIGRDAELTLIAERLADPDCRWLTVVGPGGVGKTRLVLAAAQALAPRFRHGALWFSGRDEVTALGDPESLAHRVIDRIGADRVHAGALLLVLDNLETVPEPGQLVRRLLARAPGVRLLVTSRRRLGGSREWLLELSGLSLARQGPDPQAGSPAAALLTAAVRRLDPRFDPVAEAEAVERLCARVGGLPLALELAARGVLDAGLRAVLARVESGAPLEDRERDDGERHHSIAAVMAEAWSTLPPDAQATVLRLAWLPGAFDLELAEVAGASSPAVEVLRSQSWLHRTDDGTLALHPLQQAFLRRLPEAAVWRASVRQALAGAIGAALPALESFAPWPDTATSAVVLSGRPLFAASVLADALEHQLDAAAPGPLERWVDGVVALLWAADRQAEAALLLERAAGRGDLPDWRLAGWQLRRAEIMNVLGDSITLRQAGEEALARLALDRPLRDGSRWHHLPGAAARVLLRHGWPTDPADAAAFSRLVLRGLMLLTQQLAFTSSSDRSVRANLLALVWAACHGGRADRQVVRQMAAFGTTNSGLPRLGRWLQRSLRGRQPLRSDALLEAFIVEGGCASRMALGQWDGLAEQLFEASGRLERLGDHRHAMECYSLLGKLLFYQGLLSRAAEVSAECTERGLRRSGGVWRAWGPFNQAEIALCRGDVPVEEVRRWVEVGSHWLTEMQNHDAAYVLRRFGLMARLAWRDGDVDRAREHALGGAAAAARIVQFGFWAHEGFAGVGDVLLALRRAERSQGGAPAPLGEAWRTFDRRLERHARVFPAGRALVVRLRGEAAALEGHGDAGRRLLDQAVHDAEAQGLRVELARSCEALDALDPASAWGRRARGLWAAMGAAGAAAG